MAISFYGSASNPTDGGTGTTSPVAITPPSSMQAGDLVFVTVCYSGTSGTISVSQAGGQTWNSLTTRNQTRNRTRSFWCVFNGTWSANPSWTTSSGANSIARMLVFRPNGGTASTWVVSVAESSGTYTAPSSPYTVTITGITTLTANEVVIAGWTSADDNTWGTLTAGWTAPDGIEQVRNTSGSYQQSQTHAYKIQESVTGTGDVSQNQATNGGDAGTRIIISFKEVKSPTTVQAILTATADQPATVEYGSAVNVPAVIEASGSQPTPTLQIWHTEVASPITGTFSPIAPVMQEAKSITPDAIEAAADQPELAVIAGAVKAVEPIAATASEPVPSVAGGAVVLPDSQSAAASQPSPSVAGGQFPDATVTPEALTAQASIAGAPASEVDTISVVAETTAQASTVMPYNYGPSTGAVTVTPEPVDAAADQPELGIIGRALVVIQEAIQGFFQTLVPVLAGSMLVVAEPILATASQLDPSPSGGAIVICEPIDATAGQPELVMAGSVVISPAPITGAFLLPGSSIEADSIVVVAEVAATAEALDPLIQGAGSMALYPEPIDAVADLPTPDISLGHTVVVDPIAGTFSEPTPTIVRTQNPTLEVEPIDGTASQPDPLVNIGTTVPVNPIAGAFSQVAPEESEWKVTRQDWPIPGYLELCDPSVKAGATIVPDPIGGTGEAVDPTTKAACVVAPDPITGEWATIEPDVPTSGSIRVDTLVITAEAAPLEPVVAGDAVVVLEPVDATGEPQEPVLYIPETELAVAVDPIDAAFEAVDPVVAADANIELGVIKAYPELLDPSVYLEYEASATPEPIDAAAGCLAPTLYGSAVVVPDPIAGTADQPEPSISAAGNITVHPAIVTGNLALADAPALEVDATIVPAPIDGEFATLTPLPWFLSVTVTPDPITGAFDQPEAQGSGVIEGTVQVAPITGAFSVAGTPSSSVSVIVVVAEVSATASLTVTQYGEGKTVSPAVITGTLSLPAPNITSAIIGTTVTPPPITGTFSAPYFTSSIDAELVPVAVDVAGGQLDPTLKGSAVVVLEPITGQYDQPTPAILTNGGIVLTPNSIDGTFAVLEPTHGLGATVAVEPIAATASPVEPYVAVGDIVPVTTTPDPIAGTFATLTPTPSGTTSVTVNVSPIDGALEQPTPTASLPCLIAVWALDVAGTPIAPNALINSVLFTPAPVDAYATHLTPHVVATSAHKQKPILKDLDGRQRFYDVTRQETMVDAPDRERIIDIYMARRMWVAPATVEFEATMETMAEARQRELDLELGKLKGEL